MGNEYTVTCSSHGSVIYRGSSESNYNYYRNGSRQCSRCVAEDNQSERDAAVRRAEQAARDERDRVLARQKELERLERIRQKDLESERERQRKAEKVRLLAARREQELKRERIKKEMLAKTTEEIMEQAKKFERLKSQTKNPFTQYKKLNTLQTVTDIRDKVNAVAHVGAVVSERVNAISADLKQTLGDDYDIIKSEMNRYKKYGTQMQSMTDVFISEFKKVFPKKNNVDEMVEDHNEATQADDDEKEWSHCVERRYPSDLRLKFDGFVC